jgi:DNA-binding IscR family transcriptional regulator
VLREVACDATHPCPFHHVLTDAQDRFLGALRGTSLADVVATSAPLAVGESS